MAVSVAWLLSTWVRGLFADSFDAFWHFFPLEKQSIDTLGCFAVLIPKKNRIAVYSHLFKGESMFLFFAVLVFLGTIQLNFGATHPRRTWRNHAHGGNRMKISPAVNGFCSRSMSLDGYR